MFIQIPTHNIPEFYVKNGIKYNTRTNMKVKDTMTEWIETQVQDSVVQSVINKFKQRSEVGIKKYNTTLDRDDLTKQDWIEHAQEEAMDLILYLEKLKRL
jgi:hypothetical protein